MFGVLAKNFNLNIPNGIKELPDKPHRLSGITNALIISDLHFPFHDKRAIEIALKDGKRNGVDSIIMLGDIVDFHGLSKFDKNPDYSKTENDIDIAVQFFEFLRQKFKGCRLIFLEGNHELRLKMYLWRKAPALAKVPELRLRQLLKLDQFGIEFFDNGVTLKLGGLHLIHGNESGIRGGINIAQTMLLRSFDSVLFANFHKRQSRDKTSLSGAEYVVHSIACLCNLRPQWFPNNDWQNGFARVEVDQKKFIVHNKRILYDGSIV